MDIAVLVLLILLNGAFAMSEIALVTARPNRLRQLAEKGDESARTALSLGKNPTRFLSTIQIGITAIGILSGIFGEAALAVPLASWLQEIGLSRAAASTIATAAAVACITYVAIILGELVPKRLAQLRAEAAARLVARPVARLAALSYPFVLLLSVSTDAFLRLLGKKETSRADLTEEDIQAMLTEGALAGVIEQQEHDLVRNVLRLDDRPAASLMTPRPEIVRLDVNAPPDAVLRTIVESGKSLFPVCRGGLESIVGVVSAKKILTQCASGAPINPTQYLSPAVYVPESLPGMKLLDRFRESGAQLIFVIDEYGDVVGIVTLRDVLVALAGEFGPRAPDEQLMVRHEDGSWLIDGATLVSELQEHLGLRSLPDAGKGRYNTVGGMIMHLTGSIPRTGEKAAWEDWIFEVVDLDGNRVDKILAIRRDKEV